MADTSTWVKIDRNMLRWQWFQTPNTAHLFLCLVIKANVKDAPFRNITVKRGQLVTSLPSLSRDTGLSIQQVRTALMHLISTGEVTEDTTRGYRLITLLNYDKYQSGATGKSTGNQQAINRQRNTDQRSIRKKEGKEHIYAPPTEAEVAAFAQAEGLSIDARAFINYNESRGWAGVVDWRPLVRLAASRHASTSDQETDAFGRPIRKEYQDA